MDNDPNKVMELSNDEIKAAPWPRANSSFETARTIRSPVSRTSENWAIPDLGDLLVAFASGNHAFMRGSSAKLDKDAPGGLFSLEFPGSQGSHAGHSGILQGDPEIPGSGRLSQAEFAQLASRAKGSLPAEQRMV